MADTEFILHGARQEIITSADLGEHFFSRLQQHGASGRVALVQQVDGVEVSVTYSELLRHGKVVAGLLRQHGLGSGDTVMLCCGNTLDFAPIMLGAMFVGAALAPVNPAFDKSDMFHLINVIKPQFVICNAQASTSVQEALTQYNTPVEFIPMEAVNKRLKENPGVEDFYLGKVDDPDTHVAFVMCSSGTSGKPKGVELVHSRILPLLDTYHLMPSADALTDEQDVALNLSGPFWVSCQTMTLFAMHLGMKFVLLQTFTPEYFLQSVQKYKVHLAILGPDSLIALAKFPALEKYDMSSLRAILYGGAPMSRAMLDLAQVNLKTAVTVLYGMTECFAVTPAYGVTHKPCNVGRLAPNVSAKIVDLTDGKPLGPSCEGEICFKSETRFKGYRGNPQATADMFDKDGFLHTGDVGYFDQDGFLFVVDRIKELIKYRRDHVPATDIEEVLLQHPGVLQAAVFGVYHETDWEHATAVVVRRPGANVTQQELVTLVQESLPQFKWLHGGVHFTDSLPTTSTGKIQKNILRKNYSTKS